MSNLVNSCCCCNCQSAAISRVPPNTHNSGGLFIAFISLFIMPFYFSCAYFVIFIQLHSIKWSLNKVMKDYFSQTVETIEYNLDLRFSAAMVTTGLLTDGHIVRMEIRMTQVAQLSEPIDKTLWVFSWISQMPPSWMSWKCNILSSLKKKCFTDATFPSNMVTIGWTVQKL